MARAGQSRVPGDLLGEPRDRDSMLHAHLERALQVLRPHTSSTPGKAGNKRPSEKEHSSQCVPGVGGLLCLLRSLPLRPSAVHHQPDPRTHVQLPAEAVFLPAEGEHAVAFLT